MDQMKTKETIPVVVGVTGHRTVREEDRAALREAVKSELKKLQKLCPHSPLVMLSSLAEGSDLLCADVAMDLDIPLIAVLPREQADYRRDFSEAALQRFAEHYARAQQAFVAPFTEEVPEGGPDRDFQFRQAGIYIAAHAHVMIALWDGGPGTQAACGTAEAVDFALHGDYRPDAGMPLRDESNAMVIHVFTPRGERTGEAAGTVHLLGDTEAVKDLLHRTDDFNRCLKKRDPEASSWLPPDAEEDPVLHRMDVVGNAASKVSAYYARRYRVVLALLASCCGLLTLFFLLYDEAQLIWMILLCGLMLFGAWLCRRYAVSTDCQRRSLEFRVLSESLRVQCSLRYAGNPAEAAGLMSWSQRQETPWILLALCVLCIGEAPEKHHDIRSCWAEDQLAYHRDAGLRSGGKLALSERIVRIALGVSVGLYLLGVAYELLCGGLIFPPRFEPADPETGRTVLKILMGTLSALTLFTADYYGKLSLSRTTSDHAKMERFYARMIDRLERWGQTDEVLTAIAREELAENAGWFSYQKDNTPDIGL